MPTTRQQNQQIRKRITVNKMITICYRCDEDREALWCIVEKLGVSKQSVQLDYGWTKSVDEYRATSVFLLALIRKIWEVVRLIFIVLLKGGDVLLYCTPHPAFRILHFVTFGRLRCICYLRTQHFIKTAQSLSDRIFLVARRLGINWRFLNNYDADILLVPGVINKNYLLWRGIDKQRCYVVGMQAPSRTRNVPGKAVRFVVASQNWRGHGFSEEADDQKEHLPLVCKVLRIQFGVEVFIRPHPRDLDIYETESVNRSANFIDTVSASDILITGLSSLATDCSVLGVKIVFYVRPCSSRAVQITMEEYKFAFVTTVEELILEIRRILNGEIPVSETLLKLTDTIDPEPFPKI